MAESNTSANPPASPRRPVPTRSLGTRLAILGGAFAVALLVALRVFGFAPFSIPSGSMEPTLQVGDYIIVATYPYGWSRYTPLIGLFMPQQGRIFYRPPTRGDVVVFRPPGNPQETFIKRVIGLPGDKVQLKGGVIYINDVPVPQTRVSDYAEVESGIPPTVRWRYVETLPEHRPYEVLLTAGGVKASGRACDDPTKYSDDLENTCPFLVPPDRFFMLGDNRDYSADSRLRAGIVGMVPAENLIGRAELILFSWDSGPRFDRIGKSVR